MEEVEAACQGKAAPEVCKVAAGDTRCYGRSAAMAGSVRLWAAMLREEEAESELLRCRGATKLGNDDTMQSLYWIIDASWQCTLDTALYLDAISSLSWNISNVPKLQQSLIEQMLSHNNEIPGLISGGFMKA
ncbi:hypothetical protein OsJ_14776 [Oryza sativa Japonica Group]|uniref:Uncharacterized protein n=1 Tax=Oryza sativa subsp. japonica TaxID=39947 RepID=B9FF50_ORYSJ|nr:hypothetical protein OsJ_14776 [Oryza sativa Japonica Group]